MIIPKNNAAKLLTVNDLFKENSLLFLSLCFKNNLKPNPIVLPNKI